MRVTFVATNICKNPDSMVSYKFSSTHISPIFLLVLSCIPIGILAIFIGLFIVNNPFQDDLDALIAPTAKLASKPFEWRIFIDTVFGQDDERRHILSRMLSYSMFTIFGKLDLRVLVTIGMSSYLVLLVLVYRVWFNKNSSVSNRWFLLIVLVLCTPINYSAILQSMVPIQHISVYIWCFVSLWFLANVSPKNLFFAILFTIIAISCDVTGNLILPMGVLVLLLQRQYKVCVIWIIVIGTLTFLYFKGLEIPSYRPQLKDNIKNWDQMILIILAMPGMLVDIFPTLPPNYKIFGATVAGSAVLIFLSYQFYQFIKKNIPFNKPIDPKMLWIWSCIGLMVATFLMFAVGRASEKAGSILVARYKHMYIYWSIFVFLLLIQTSFFKQHIRVFWRILLPTSIFFFINGYWQVWSDTDYLRKIILTDAYGWYHNRAIPSSPIYLAPFVKDTVDKMYISALKTKVYQLPPMEFSKLSELPYKDSTDINLMNDIDRITVFTSPIERTLSPYDGVYILLKSATDTHILPAQTQRNTLWQLLKTCNYYKGNALSCQYMKKFLTNNTKYTVWLGVLQGESQYVLKTNGVIQTDL